MPSRNRLNKFSKKYSWFLSEASNEEIVSISKEISHEMAGQIKLLNTMATALMAIAAFLIMLVTFLIFTIESQTTGYSDLILFARLGSILLLCIALFFAFRAANKSLTAASMAPLMWNSVRETVNEENAYEQMTVINELNKSLYLSRNNLKISSLLLFLGVAIVAVTYILELLAVNGYL